MCDKDSLANYRPLRISRPLLSSTNIPPQVLDTMAGDHKCPVCQSTFTRPQHVARHMRSHTGDRPYKCQHCGDQFARSDLLSRHINKCHASEKPPTTTAPSRRKGFAAASRATTSKQACDQCVTSSLPCDGANPCSKCVQRKCRCTYVKFHRQTAPAGPGHPLPPSLPPAGVARHSISLGAPRLPDDFLLAPPPGTMNLSSMYAPQHQYAIHSSAVYPHDYTSLPPLASALAPSESPMPSVLQGQHRDVIDNPDAMARMRAQAELLSRAGVMQNGSLTLAQPAPSTDTSGALPGLYAAAAGAQDAQYDRQYDRYTLPPPVQWEAQRHYSQKDFEEPYGPRSQSHPTTVSYSAAGAAGGEPSLQTHPPTAVASSSYHTGAASGAPYPHGAATSLYTQQQAQPRSDDMSGSEGEFSSDAASTGTGHSHSIPSSANSSAVHLPLPGFNNLRTRADMGGKEHEQQRYQGEGQSTNSHEGEGGFSSAFGLMSLDDPNVLAGLSNDGQPFFSGFPFSPGNSTNGLSLATPTQDLIAQLKSAGGREGMDSKEMRDFWKMYLKTPLTGPNSSGGGGIMFPLQTPTGPGSQLGHGMVGAGRPSPPRRHSRVASLPSMKTPPLFAEERLGSYARPSTGDASQSQDPHANAYQGQPQQGGYNSTVRTTLHDTEDLKSYEQAVLARNAPMQLNLVRKRKESAASGQGAGKSKSMSPVVPPAAFARPPSTSLPGTGMSKIAELLNRPASSSSAGTAASSAGSVSVSVSHSVSGPSSDAGAALGQASSSLAHAFGGEHAQAQAQAQAEQADSYEYMAQHQQQQQQQTSSSASFRPSFKRLASQTLGPANAKRALLGPAGWDHDEVDDVEEEEDGGEYDYDYDDEEGKGESEREREREREEERRDRDRDRDCDRAMGSLRHGGAAGAGGYGVGDAAAAAAASDSPRARMAAGAGLPTHS
ncbi:hypothetical protein L227DRAFT_332810 [Lentinus tigrinus ALCF2SS1-6]|uniref:Zn(2)-C6 fungal-type domain-containing protein n=1 Tax=Lentinus tigrinus ALCF2SS1-6 TaxID=1328759 RepID=A0A5C2RTH6_9APHY|nr:hypothetical protein L227DRAFT_332810 [Lentinus tigrinus ALCF2SS1-6]